MSCFSRLSGKFPSRGRQNVFLHFLPHLQCQRLNLLVDFSPDSHTSSVILSDFICPMLQRSSSHFTVSNRITPCTNNYNKNWLIRKQTSEKAEQFRWSPRLGVWLTGCEVVSLGVLLTSAAIHLGRYYWVDVWALLFKVDNRWVGFAVGLSSSDFLRLYRDWWHDISTAPNNFSTFNRSLSIWDRTRFVFSRVKSNFLFTFSPRLSMLIRFRLNCARSSDCDPLAPRPQVDGE